MKQPKLTRTQALLLRVATAPGRYIVLAWDKYPVLFASSGHPNFVMLKSKATEFPTMLAAHEAAKQAGLEHWTVKELR